MATFVEEELVATGKKDCVTEKMETKQQQMQLAIILK